MKGNEHRSLSGKISGGQVFGFFLVAAALSLCGTCNTVDDVVFALSEGEISAPVVSPSGYHIFQVLEVFPAGPAPREEIEPEVLRRLGEIAARRHASACVRKLAGEVGVTVIHEQLWFRYDGRYSEVIHAS